MTVTVFFVTNLTSVCALPNVSTESKTTTHRNVTNQVRAIRELPQCEIDNVETWIAQRTQTHDPRPYQPCPMQVSKIHCIEVIREIDWYSLFVEMATIVRVKIEIIVTGIKIMVYRKSTAFNRITNTT